MHTQLALTGSSADSFENEQRQFELWKEHAEHEKIFIYITDAKVTIRRQEACVHANSIVIAQDQLREALGPIVADVVLPDLYDHHHDEPMDAVPQRLEASANTKRKAKKKEKEPLIKRRRTEEELQD